MVGGIGRYKRYLCSYGHGFSIIDVLDCADWFDSVEDAVRCAKDNGLNGLTVDMLDSEWEDDEDDE